MTKISSLAFFWKFYSFRPYIWVFDALKVNFRIGHEIGIQIHSFSWTSSPSTIVLKTIILFHWMILTPPQKQIYHRCMICFWTLNSILFIHMSTFMPVPHCLSYYDFTYSAEIESVNSQLFKKYYFRYFQFLVFPFKFYNKHINSCKKKKTVGILIGIVVNL